MEDGRISGIVIGAAIEVHRNLGPGLLESVYEQCLAHVLTTRGVQFQRQKAIPVKFDGIFMDCGFRADFIVESSVVVELKAIEALAPIHTAQLPTYLKLTGCKIGLLINFNCARLHQGIKRVVLNL